MDMTGSRPTADEIDPATDTRIGQLVEVQPALRRPAGGSETTLLELVGDSPPMRAVARQIEKIARSDAPILIQGETGSGKELAARAILRGSARRAGPLVAVNCGAIPDGLIETELFGHSQGAFTDAKHARAGAIALAQGGALFLDEIDTLSPKGQVTLLRFLQDFRYRAVGSCKEIVADLRVIAASNQPLQRLVEDGRFRRDLLYRVNIFELSIPPLRNRESDIEVLAQHFIVRFSRHYDIPVKTLHPGTLESFRHYAWPGNVRELENWIHRELLLTEGDEICSRIDQPVWLDAAADRDTLEPTLADYRTAKARALADFESTYVTRALAEAGGNVTMAARIAGKERRSFGKLLKKHGIARALYHA
jgi:two-component system, NtrC family, response regulator GlrR